jgi:hypothetical protein
MDPNTALEEIRRLVDAWQKILAQHDRSVRVTIPVEVAVELVETIDGLDGWLSKGGFLPAAWGAAEKPRRADGAPRMTIAQRDALWELCGRYNVLFREGDYLPAFDLPDGWYNGWVGGLGSRCSLFVGVSPDGEVSS